MKRFTVWRKNNRRDLQYLSAGVILCAVITLPACGKNEPPAITESAAATEPPLITTMAAPVLTTTPNPTETAPTSTEPPGYQAPPGLPDFSERLAALEPFRGQRSEIVSRWYPDTVYELIPRDDYGRLYPFPVYNPLDKYSGAMHGLMTADGKVVLDAFYGITYIDWKDGYYLLSQYDIEISNAGNYNEAQISYIMPADGSRIREQKGIRSNYEQPYLGNGEFIIYDNDDVGVVDVDGNWVVPLMNIKDNYYTFGYGEVGGYFISKTGGENIYHAVPVPDKAEVNVDGDLITYKKIGDEYVKEIMYLPIHEINNNLFMSYGRNDSDTGYDKTVFTDKNGNILKTLGTTVNAIGNFIIETWSRSDIFPYISTYIVYDLNFNELFQFETSRWYRVIDNNIFADGVLYDMSGNQTRLFPESTDIYYADNDRVIVNSGDKYGLYNKDFEEILPVEYDKLDYICDGLYSVLINGYNGLINEIGEWIFKTDLLKSID